MVLRSYSVDTVGCVCRGMKVTTLNSLWDAHSDRRGEAHAWRCARSGLRDFLGSCAEGVRARGEKDGADDVARAITWPERRERGREHAVERDRPGQRRGRGR